MQSPFHDILSLLFDYMLSVIFYFSLYFNYEIENNWYHVHWKNIRSLNMSLVLHNINSYLFSCFVLNYFHDYQTSLISCCYLSIGCLYTWPSCYPGIVSTRMLLFPLRWVAILETNNQSILLFPFMKIDEKRIKKTNLSLAFDFLSFSIELRRFFFVFPASKEPVESQQYTTMQETRI